MMETHDNTKINAKNIDTYIIKKAILDALDKESKNMSGVLLDVGCGKMPYKQFILSNSEVNKYVGIDIKTELAYDENVAPDYYWDGVKMPFADREFDVVIATEVLEHCPDPERILKECQRVLKDGGLFFFTVPFLWNLHDVPFDEYRYTPFALERHLNNAGFSHVNINPTGGWHLSLAQMLGLWVKRAPHKMGNKLMLFLIKHVMKYLMKISVEEEISFKEGQMITGLYGTSIK
jgi:SAM-dependent methyltransferase